MSQRIAANILTMVDTTFQDRLNEAMREAKMDTASLAARLGISYQAVRKAQDGRTKSLSAPNNAIAAAALGVESTWLATGAGPKRPASISAVEHIGEYTSNAQVETTRPYPSGNRIPVVGTAQLGDNGHFVELEYPAGHGDGWVHIASRDPNAYALRCRGDSMKPRIRSGEFVVVEPNTEPSPGDEVLVKAADGRVMIKTYLYRREGRVHLVSVNEAHPSIALDEREVAAMHYVGAIVKASRWTTG